MKRVKNHHKKRDFILRGWRLSDYALEMDAILHLRFIAASMV